MSTDDRFGDERLRKADGRTVRAPRDSADSSRVEDGMTLSAEERRRQLRKDWVQEILPTPPQKDGWHRCWLSTTNSIDPIYKRIALGYQPVKAKDVPGIGSQYTIATGEFEGCVAVNEMLLFEVPDQLYNDLMMINHHDMPLEQEQDIREKVMNQGQVDGRGQNLARGVEGFDSLGRQVATPSFIS